MKIKLLVAVVLAAMFSVAPWSLYAEDPQPAPAAVDSGAASDDASLYADGTKAINESRWQDAVGLFDKVAQQHGEHAEGALYWKAYAENKEGQAASALSTCGELRQRYPKSRWIEECGALEIEIRGKSGDPVAPQAESDENLKLLALNALMQQDQAQAIPILQKILSGNQSEELEEPGAVCPGAEPVAGSPDADRSDRAWTARSCAADQGDSHGRDNRGQARGRHAGGYLSAQH